MLDLDNVTATARKRVCGGGDSSREPELMMVARVGPYHIINPPKKEKKNNNKDVANIVSQRIQIIRRAKRK